MPTTRSYGDACGVARALDVVGERWALPVVRELLFGPRRFSDLRDALPGVSSNLLTDRLRELTGRGVLSRHKLAPPAGSWVYELTEWGRRLEPILLALGSWGLEVPPPEPASLSATSVLIFLRGAGHPAAGHEADYRVVLDETVWTVRVEGGAIQVRAGEPQLPVAGIRTDPETFNAVLADPTTLGALMAQRRIVLSGDSTAVPLLLGSVTGQPG